MPTFGAHEEHHSACSNVRGLVEKELPNCADIALFVRHVEPANEVQPGDAESPRQRYSVHDKVKGMTFVFSGTADPMHGYEL
ncbi:MAG: hypothetical protein ACM3U2_18245 [Deltaproteobacteria bacterium]